MEADLIYALAYKINIGIIMRILKPARKIRARYTFKKLMGQ